MYSKFYLLNINKFFQKSAVKIQIPERKMNCSIVLILQLSFSAEACTIEGIDGTGDCATGKNLNCKKEGRKLTCQCADNFDAVKGVCTATATAKPELGKLISFVLAE